MNDIVSVIVPVYKVEEILLRRSIESIMEQTYKFLEILIINDGSPDKSGEICDVYAQKDSRIRVFHIPNGGVSKARNYGIKKSTGDYIMFVDSDDYLESNCIELLLNNLKDTKADCSMCAVSYVDEIDMESKVCNVEQQCQVLSRSQAVEALFYLMQIYEGYEVAAVWGCIYRKEVVEDVLFNENMIIGEDFVYKYQAFLNIDKLVCTNQKLYAYLIREKSAMRNGFNEKKINTIDELDKMIENKNNLIPEYRDGFISRSVNIAMVILLMIPIEGQYGDYRARVKEFIKKFRWSTMTNPKTRLKVKLSLLISYFGFDTVQRLFALFGR